MNGADVPKERAETSWRQQFVSDVFHTLSQPLTALHCSLELALRKKGNIEQQRKALQDALDMTKRAIDSTRFVRLLAEAEDPGDVVVLDLTPVLREVLDEATPVAASQGSVIKSDLAERTYIEADESRLRQALFLVIDHCLREAGSRPLVIDSRISGREIVVTMGPRVADAELAGTSLIDSSERGLVLADRIVRAIGGEIAECRSGEGLSVYIRLPLRERG